MAISIEQIKELREATGASPVEIKKALEQTQGDVEKAKEILRAISQKVAGKKSDREASQGMVDTYVHPNQKTGVLLDIRCETDFVASSPEFRALAHDVSLQIAAMPPESVEALLQQPWIKDSTKTINDLVEATTGKVGERIQIRQFARFEI